MNTLVAGAQRLSPAEAEGLWRAWSDRRDGTARDRLIVSYSPMVKYLAARKVRELPSHCELDDLVSCGLVALVEAVDRFDPKKGATFEQYAWTRVSGAIMDELRRQDWAPRSLRRSGRAIDRARERWQSENGRLPSDAELARELDISLSDLVSQLEGLNRADLVSLNTPARGVEDSMLVEVGDTIVAQSLEHDPEAAALAGERSAHLERAVAALSEREQKILALVHVHELQGAEIGRILGVSESRVSQILAGIRRKLHDAVDAYDTMEDLAA